MRGALHIPRATCQGKRAQVVAQNGPVDSTSESLHHRPGKTLVGLDLVPTGRHHRTSRASRPRKQSKHSLLVLSGPLQQWVSP